MKTTQNEGNPEGSSNATGGIMPAGTDVSLDERLLSEAHDAMLTAEDALTEFCGHNDETRGGWALQALTRSIENIRSRVRIAGTSAHPGSYPVGTESHAQASQKTAQEGSVCEVEPLGEVTFKVISGVEGHCLSVNDRRVAGPKPWAGGRVLKTWKVPMKQLLEAVGLPSSPPSSEDTELLTAVDPGEGWRLLEEGEPLQKGDGFLDPKYPYGWLDYLCRPDIFRGNEALGCPVKDYAHTWPWRRKVEASTTPQKGGQGV